MRGEYNLPVAPLIKLLGSRDEMMREHVTGLLLLAISISAKNQAKLATPEAVANLKQVLCPSIKPLSEKRERSAAAQEYAASIVLVLSASGGGRGAICAIAPLEQLVESARRVLARGGEGRVLAWVGESVAE